MLNDVELIDDLRGVGRVLADADYLHDSGALVAARFVHIIPDEPPHARVMLVNLPSHTCPDIMHQVHRLHMSRLQTTEMQPALNPITTCSSSLLPAPSRNTMPHLLHGLGNCRAAAKKTYPLPKNNRLTSPSTNSYQHQTTEVY